MKRKYLNMIKAIDDKYTANIVFNDEKPETLPLKPGRKECPLSLLPFNSVESPS